ncbi:MAG: hypothetical protein AAF907_15420, partial [Planctomycetota bacterium]
PAEFERFGGRFAGPATADGWRPCHALGRKDRNPSASFNVRTGVYKDHGTGVALTLFDLAAEALVLADWRAARDQYAEQVGLPVDPPAASPSRPVCRKPPARRIRPRRPAGPEPDPRVRVVERECRAALTPQRLIAYAGSLGVPPDALASLGFGWCDRRNAGTFPMRAADGGVRGVRTRTAAGAKRAVTGSRDGLFLPAGWTADPPERPDRLVICEGPTDTAALLAWGFAAAGRPSAHGAAGIVADLCSRLRPAEVVILADADGPGRQGADKLAAGLLPSVPAVRVCEPPAGVKDARAWFNSGATAAKVAARFDAALVRSLAVRRAGREGGDR